MDEFEQDDEEDLVDTKERRQRRFKNKNNRDKNRQHDSIRREKISSRPRQKFNMNTFDLDDWEEWEDDYFD